MIQGVLSRAPATDAMKAKRAASIPEEEESARGKRLQLHDSAAEQGLGLAEIGRAHV